MLDEKTRDHSLIGSDRVEGTSVYGKENNKIGSVQRIMIDKLSGQARDVEVSVGAFLGMGGKLHSLPWEKLKYNSELGGYKLDVTEEQLKNAPTYSDNDREQQLDRDYQSRVYSYWVATPYW
ncbi:PRC-barrel domain-containing protein [Qipengyuania oceanensis]|uniref:PRC-barrel domain containing protein n=1 Tax=Qipengyuania oceanensis TaxID=1463597 RepID=A0A844YFK5_9SPHN|nr:PRC-barrel domain-containing protein [Qipengyuania oceanensis]MXO63956.1 PRC-barrel domain containing protein [Qipengyuania oceanensis]